MNIYKKELIINILIITSALSAIIAILFAPLFYQKYSFTNLYSSFHMRSIDFLKINFEFTSDQISQINQLLKEQSVQIIKLPMYRDISDCQNIFRSHWKYFLAEINIFNNKCNCLIIDEYNYFKLDQINLTKKQIELLKEYSNKNQNLTLIIGSIVTLILLLILTILLFYKKSLCSIENNQTQALKTEHNLKNLIFLKSEENLIKISL
jgi:hypothetical protein